MQPELASKPLWQGTAIPAAWRDGLLRLGIGWAALFVAMASDWANMFGQWWNSSTYNHILLIPAILIWLVWMRLPELAKLSPRCWWPGLIAAAGALLVWVLGAMAGFDLLRQAGAVALLPASALLLLGPRVGAGLLFPFFYMVFLVPFGDELVPPLQTVTAKLTIFFTHLSGVEATVNGVFIDTPAGLFHVAEACSGVKFLIAMVALGALAANVCFHSWTRRLAFMLLCVAAPILANGVRAWGTIFAAQYVGAEKAGGIDHLIYGWIFFALVIAAVLAVSWRFFDRAIDEPMVDADRINASPLLARLDRAHIGIALALVALALLLAGAKLWVAAADRLSAPLATQIALPQVSGWQRVDYHPQAWWEPRAGGADHRLLGRYADGGGHVVDVFLAVYANQDEGKEAGGFGQGALPPDHGWAWSSNGPAASNAKSEMLMAQGRYGRVTQSYYRTGDVLTGSNARLKLANIEDRLLLRARPTMLLILSAEQLPGHDPASALDAFRAAIGPVGPWMDRTAAVR